MFVQVIQGKASDAEGLRRQMKRWSDELRPGAKGFLGSTGGVSDKGEAILLARFESAEAAEANSQRREQGEWWSETEKYFDGDVTFAAATEVDTFLGGGSDDAGFVQIMKGTAADRTRLQAMDDLFAKHAPDFRPDVLGGTRAWIDATSYVEAAYFTSEVEARAGESNEPPAALAEHMAEFGSLMTDVEYVDLRDPLFA